MTGTYTATTTGIHNLTIYNHRNFTYQDLLQNYIDDISLVPVATDFTSERIQLSASLPGEQTQLDLNAGPAWAGWKYIVLLSITGNWPGVTNNGVWIPLMVDGATQISIKNANSNMFIQTKGVLDASGAKVAGLRFPNPMGSSWVGRKLYVAYILYQGPGYKPVSYASMPVTILFIP